MKSIAVFCGSRTGANPAFESCVQELTQCFLDHNISLVYGGAQVGLMGSIANKILKGGGRVIGVIPQFLMTKEIAHPGLSEMFITQSMHERKFKMAEISDGFIAFPGGFGTLDELCEIVTWKQIGLHQKPVGLLNVDGFFDGLMMQIKRSVQDGLVTEKDARLLKVSQEPRALIKDLIKDFGDSQKPDQLLKDRS